MDARKIKRFEVGKTYVTRSTDDMGAVNEMRYKIVSRTAQTIMVELPEICRAWGKPRICKYRILKAMSEHFGVEHFAPWGQYSMCEYVDANDELKEVAA